MTPLDVQTIFEDEHLVAVVKPAGLPTHAATPGQDNLVSRVQGACGGVKLGVHQRLDAVTSGLLVLSKSARAAQGLAPQFEGRTLRKTYLAVACGRVAAPDPAARRWRLTHWLTRDGDTVSAHAHGPKPPRRDAQAATTDAEALEAVGPLTRLALSPITGRTHQLRAQLAAIGHPILGDTLYGGGVGPGRTLLHAWRLSLRHPVTGLPLDLEAPPPALFGPLSDLASPLWAALAAAFDAPPDAAPSDDAFTLRCPLPHVRADRFGPWGVLHDLDAAAPDPTTLSALASGWRPLAAAWGRAHGLRGVCLKPHVTHDASLGSRRLPKPTLPLWGDTPDAAPDQAPLPAPYLVREHGVRYLVDLGEQHGCGLYLDQRENRRWVMDTIQRAPRPPAVLNLFAYTCSFSAAAASAGAARVTSVDIAKRPLAWGRDTFALNGLDPAAHAFYPDDVHGVLARSLRRGASFDVIICDPPSFGHGRRAASLHQALSDLAAACAQVLAPRGWLLLCLNHRATAPADFRARALHGIQRAARDVLSADLLLPPPDAPPGGTALKTLRVQVA